MNQTCKNCKGSITEAFYFCPNCGKKLKEPPFRFSVSKSVGILIFSLLFPPFGIIPGIKYLFKKDIRARVVGVLTIALTLIITIILINFISNFLNRTMEMYNEILNVQGGYSSINNETEILQEIKELQ